MNSEEKERNLKNRLDGLEKQVLALHSVLARRKQQAALLNEENNQQENAVKNGQSNVASRPANQLKLVQSRYRKTSERKLFCNQELYEYLANITKHIANGSNAVSKLASLSRLYETPMIKSILLPREYFYDVAPELRTFDANFSVGPSYSRNPLSRLVNRRRVMECSCCKMEGPPRKGSTGTVKSISNRTRTASCISSKSKCAKCDYLEKQVIEQETVTSSSLEKQISKLKNELKSKTDNFKKKLDNLEKKLIQEHDLRISAEKTLSGMEKEMELMAKKMRKFVGSKRRSSPVNQINQEAAEEYDVMDICGNERRHSLKMSDRKDENQKNDKAVCTDLNEDSYMSTNMAELNEQLEKAVACLQNQLKLERHNQHESNEKARAAEKACKELKIRMFIAEELHAKEIKRLIDSNNHLMDSITQLQFKSTSDMQVQTTSDPLMDSITQLQFKSTSDMQVQTTSDESRMNDVSETELTEDNLKKALEEQNNLIESLKQELKDTRDKLKQTEDATNEFKSKICQQKLDIETLKNEICTNKDTISIKDAMLNDQLDTINNLKEASENSKYQLYKESEKQQKTETEVLNISTLFRQQYYMELQHLNQENAELKARIDNLEASLMKAEKYRKSQAKYLCILKQLEEKIDEKQKQWQQQVACISNERDEAIKTARFASRKLVQAVSVYESKMKAQKQCADLLRISLKEKENKLEVANQQIEILNTQVWKSTQISQCVNNDLRCKLKRACEVCTDLLEDCCATNSEGIN